MPDHEKCKVVKLTPVLPAFVKDQLYVYCKDAEHATKGDLHKINPETQATIANILRSMVDPSDPSYGKSFTPSIPIPIGELGLPGKMTIKIWPKDMTDLSKGPKDVLLNYEVLRW
jgi:hypothetical protein